ncbi:hypothetical protein [Rhizobacter fulvus]
MKVSIQGSDAFVESASIVNTEFGWTLVVVSNEDAFLLTVPDRSDIPSNLKFDVVPRAWDRSHGSQPAGLVVCMAESMYERRAMLNASRPTFTDKGRRMELHIVVPGKTGPDQGQVQASG